MIVRPDQSVSLLRTMTEKQQEQTSIAPIADLGAKEVQTIICPATAGATQADYFVFVNKAGTVYAAWIDIDADGTTPTGAAYVAAGVKIKLSIATGDTAAQVATKVKNLIEADGGFTGIVITKDVATLTFTQTLMGNVAAPARHNSDDSGNGSFTVSTLVGGNASNLQNKYFLINSPTVSYYAWINVNGEGVDPAQAGTPIEVAISAGATASDIASAIATAVGALAAFDAVADTTNGYVFINTTVAGEATNAGAGNSGFTLAIGRQGCGDIFAPYMSPSVFVNEPVLIGALS